MRLVRLADQQVDLMRMAAHQPAMRVQSRLQQCGETPKRGGGSPVVTRSLRRPLQATQRVQLAESGAKFLLRLANK